MDMKVNVKPDTGIITISDQESRSGWFGLEFYLLMDGQALTAMGGKLKELVKDRSCIWEGILGPDIALELKIYRSPGGKGWAVTPSIRNATKDDISFSGYGFRIAEGMQGVSIDKDISGIPVFMHTDNLRYEKLPHCCPTFPLIRPLPQAVTQLGDQASGPIPVIFWGKSEGDVWLMEGSLTQRRHVLTWNVGLPIAPIQMLEYSSHHMWTGGADETLSKNSFMELESTVYKIISSKPDKLYSYYLDEIKSLYSFAGKKSILDCKPVYCTWNYDVFTNITESDCMKRLDILEKVQGGGFFQIDHGYQPPTAYSKSATPEVDAFFPDADHAWDLERFPSGPKGFTSACRKRGLKPSIWWSPRVQKDGIIQQVHPEWILLDNAGSSIDVGHLLLDCSVPEVRVFMEQCVRTITKDWGFEGIKLDFYSWMFDYPDLKFRGGGTGVAWKSWLVRMIRSYLGPDAYLLHCVSCPMGNPFPAVEGFDAFRVGIDIHSGEWNYHLKSCSWLLPGILFSGKDTWYANIDSCMGKPGIPSGERRFRCAFAYMTGGMLEFSGPIEKLDEESLDDYRRLVRRSDQGGMVECPDEAAFWGKPLPRILIRHHEKESRTRRNFGILASIGFFNWSDTEEIITMSANKFRLDLTLEQIKAVDFWNGNKYEFQEEFIRIILPPRGHILLDIEMNIKHKGSSNN